MSNTKERRELISVLENYAEQLVVKAYARTTQQASDDLSDEVLKELADAVEKRLITAVKTSVESAQKRKESIPD